MSWVRVVDSELGGAGTLVAVPLLSISETFTKHFLQIENKLANKCQLKVFFAPK